MAMSRADPRRGHLPREAKVLGVAVGWKFLGVLLPLLRVLTGAWLPG